MTDLDAIIDSAVIDRPSPREPRVPQHFGTWRVISLVAVLAALIITAASVFQARAASDVPVPERDPIALRQISVSADAALSGADRVQVLGLAESESRRSFETAGTSIDVPDGLTSIVALSSDDDDLIGLAIVDAGISDSVQVSARSTARALVLMSPGILGPDAAESMANLEVVEADAAFDKLVAALEQQPNLSSSNDAVEQAFAEIADRLPAPRPAADQGCDSVVSPAAYAAAGACAQPESTGILVSNEQDRWALVFGGAPDYEQVCDAVAPAGTGSARVLITADRCIGEALIATPGPLPLSFADDATAVDRVRVAGAVHQLYAYVGPFADLAGGSAGFTQESVRHIAATAPEMVETLDLVLGSNEDLVAAMDVTQQASTALDRHTAAILSARLLLEASNTTNLIPHRALGDDAHVAVLDFYERAGERMLSSRTDWRWEVRAVDTIDFGSDR